MRHPVLVILLLAVASTAFSQKTAREYLNYLPPESAKALFASGQVGEMGGTLGELKLWQNGPFDSFIRSAYGQKTTTITADSLFLLDNPKTSTPEERNLKIYRSFTSFSTMKGLEAFSVSKQKMETFIFDSSRVVSAEKPDRLPDPVADKVPNEIRYTIYEKEEQTGDVYSEFLFAERPSWLEVTLTNVTSVKYLFLTLVQPRELSTTFLVIPASDKIVLYGLTMAKTPTLFGLEKLKRQSFFNRMKALASWFEKNLKRE